MGEENDRGDNPNFFNDHRSSAERITSDPGALRGILSKMEFEELLKARLVCKHWNKESGFFIKNRIDFINFEKDSRLKRYLKSEDHHIFQSIKLNIGKLSAEVLGKCGLEKVKNLCLTGITRYQWFGVPPDWCNIWKVKEKILSLLQPPNNISFLKLHFRFPVNLTNEEAMDFVGNVVNLRSLSIHLCLSEDRTHSYSRPNDIASILITNCHSLAHLETVLNDWFTVEPTVEFLGDLNKLLIRRKEKGHPNFTLSILPKLEVNLENCEDFKQLANFGLRLETLKVKIRFKNNGTQQQQQLNETFKASETLLGNTSDILKDLHLSFEYEGYQSTDKFQLKVPSLPNLQKVQLGVFIRGDPGANVEAEQFFQLPDEFPSLKQLVVGTKDMVAFHGKGLPNLDRLTYANEFRIIEPNYHIPSELPTFPSIRAVDCNDAVSEKFLRFVFTNLTSIQELKIKLQRRIFGLGYSGPYVDTWKIFTGGAQPPHNVAPPPNSSSDDEDGSDEEDEVAGNPVNDKANNVVGNLEHLVASLQNYLRYFLSVFNSICLRLEGT